MNGADSCWAAEIRIGLTRDRVGPGMMLGYERIRRQCAARVSLFRSGMGEGAKVVTTLDSREDTQVGGTEEEDR